SPDPRRQRDHRAAAVPGGAPAASVAGPHLSRDAGGDHGVVQLPSRLELTAAFPIQDSVSDDNNRGMGKLASACVVRMFIAAPTARAAPEPDRVRIAVDGRIELFSVLCRLAGNPEYNRAFASSYVSAVDSYFAAFKDDPAVQATRALHQKFGISF